MLLHDIIGREAPDHMDSKPLECVEVERGINHREGDIYIVTYPKTGTTILQYMCHLLRTKCEGADFEDIHQVCPHTSSAWFIDQDLNAPQEAPPRLFKSHRKLEQVAPFAKGVKYIATIRDPTRTLMSVWSFRQERGNADPNEATVIDFAKSKRWTQSNNGSSVTSYFDHIAGFWKCRHASNFLLIPFEDFVECREKWLPLIADFMGVSCNDSLVAKVAFMTSKEEMLKNVSKFDESWCRAQREAKGRPHPKIIKDAAKVTRGHDISSVLQDEELKKIQQSLWDAKVAAVTGINNYDEMRRLLCEQHFPRD